MAEEVQIQGAGSTAKIRNVIAVPVLAFVTLGIYGVVWYYKINREMADYGKAHGQTEELGDNPVMSVLAITLGALVIVPALVSFYQTFKRVQALQRITGSGEPLNGWIGLIFFLLLTLVLYGYMQSGLNSAWQAQGGVAPAAEAPADGPV